MPFLLDPDTGAQLPRTGMHKGRHGVFDRNAHLRAAFELSKQTSGLSKAILLRCYQTMGQILAPAEVRQMTESTMAFAISKAGYTCAAAMALARRSGPLARAVHIVAGNWPLATAMSFVRNIVARSDGIFKTPSNDPLTASAIAATMIDMAPDHPITKHTSVAY